MPAALGETLIILVLILANGFFAGAEIAIVASRRGRLKKRAEEGDLASRIALELANDPNRFLPTVQVGITLIGTFAAAFGGARLVDYLEPWLAALPVPLIAGHGQSIALAIVVMGVAFFSLIFGELVPKRLALRNAEGLARHVALPMQVLAQVARPVVWLLGFVTNCVLFLLGSRAGDDSGVSVDDIQHLIELGTSRGILEPSETKVALEALRLGDHTVRDIVRPRIDLDALEVNTPSDEIIGVVAMAGFSRLPVYEKDLDHILGFVHIKDVLRQIYLRWPLDLRKMLHPALFVPETLPLDRLLELFQQKSTQLAIVLDEFGGTEGMVTLEDVFAELVGEIRDEHRQGDDEDFVQRDDGSWSAAGSASVDDLVEKLGIKPTIDPSVPRRYTTVAGLVLARLGRIPRIGERASWEGLDLEVVDMDGQRIDRVLVKPLPDSPEASTSAN